MSKKFYITTTLPYVNADPHIGFALEIIEADVLARFHRSLGDEVFFNTGTDEHGAKIFEKAKEKGITPQELCDEAAKKYQELKSVLNLSYNSFVRTTNEKHIKAAQEFWRICKEKGDIYKKNYKTKYCVGCELQKTESDLVDGKCPLHPNREIETIEEENYFFRFSNYQEKLLDLYKNNPDFVLPQKRLNEIKAFVERGPEDFSISRLKTKLPWGVPVPDDPEHVMYVWFDALVNYISALDWPCHCERVNKLGAKEGPDEALCKKGECNFKNYWPAVQVCGKDNLRQQAAMWQAMLMSAGIENSKRVFVSGFINVNGQKMSKSLGNVISPFEMVEKFGTDATRYLLLSFGNFGEDMDVTWERMTEKYNADLANGLGNLLSRVIKLAENFKYQIPNIKQISNSKSQITDLMEKLELGNALNYIWKIVQEDNKFIEDNKPWELAKNNSEKFKKVMEKLIGDLYLISELLVPFMPETSEKIKKALNTKETRILFQRIK